jgi:hypothetical protein
MLVCWGSAHFGGRTSTPDGLQTSEESTPNYPDLNLSQAPEAGQSGSSRGPEPGLVWDPHLFRWERVGQNAMQ